MTSDLSPNAYSYTLGVGALNGFLVAFLLLRSDGQRLPNRLLAALVAVVALRLVPYILGYAGFYDVYPWLSFAPFDQPLAVGPLLWLYVRALTEGGLPARWRWHLLPAGLHFLAWSAIFVLASPPQKNWIYDHVLPWVLPLIKVGGTAGFAVYVALAYRRFADYQRWLNDNLSNREEYRLGWLHTLVILLGITAVAMSVFVLVDWLLVPLDYFDEYPLYVWLAALCYSIGLLAWRGSATVYPVPSATVEELEPPDAEETAPEPSRVADRTPADWAELGATFAAEIRARELWRDPQLTLRVLARKLGSNTSYVSRALNAGLGVSFNQCINRFRAEYVALRIREGDPRELMEIATEAGFNSKASFQRAFRDHIGGSAGEYRQQQRQASVEA